MQVVKIGKRLPFFCGVAHIWPKPDTLNELALSSRGTADAKREAIPTAVCSIEPPSKCQVDARGDRRFMAELRPTTTATGRPLAVFRIAVRQGPFSKSDGHSLTWDPLALVGLFRQTDQITNENPYDLTDCSG